MLTRLGLRNFKAFGDEMQYADLAPITLIYGPNSGGKSSIIQALLMLKQSAGTTGLFGVMGLVPRGSDVDLGSVEAFIHNHDTSRKVEIEVAAAVHEYLRSFRHIGRYFPVATIGLEFSATDTDHTAEIKAELKAMRFKVEEVNQFRLEEINQDDREGFEIQLERSDADHSRGVFRWKDEASIKSFARHIKRVADSVQHTSFDFDYADEEQSFVGCYKSMPIEELEGHLQKFQIRPSRGLRFRLAASNRDAHETDYKLEDVVNDLIFQTPNIGSEIGRMSHIGHRIAPQRAYETYGRVRRDTAGGFGEFTPHILGNDENIVAATNKWFAKCEIPYRLEADTQRDSLTGDRIVLRLSDKKGNQLTLTDVGFGVNQLLPIIVEGVVGRDRVICVEQPEIHLHPRLQAHIADFLIETSRPGETDVGNQWLVETHSELLVLRLQRRIREGIISHKDVSVLYVDPQDDGGSTIRRLELDEDGTFIDEWPQGFFEEGYREIMGY